jgi:putative membrane protein
MLRRHSVAKGLAAGAIGGLAGSIVMTHFQNAWQKAAQKINVQQAEEDVSAPREASDELREIQTGTEGTSGTRSAEVYSVRKEKAENKASEKPDNGNPPAKVAEAVARVGGKSLSSDQKEKGGMVVHYAFGTLMGALYGVAAEMGARRIGRNSVLSGMGFGAALFAGADEVAVPALRLSKSPAEVSWAEHLYGFAAHLVYGTTAAAVFKATRKAM